MTEPDDLPPESVKLRIRREAGGLWSRGKSAIAGLWAGMWRRLRDSGLGDWYSRHWAASKRFRVVNYLLGAFLAMNLILWVAVTRNLPSADSLLTYQPPLPTMVRGVNGEIVYSYARERRVQLRFVDFPQPLINADLSAEDKTFWTHGGVDFGGLAGAAVDYVTKFGSDKRAKGGSTITQQVAKNILIGNEYSLTRKLKEMILARRIEGVLNKQQILELYLNEIPLGRQAFGVQAAAQAYFGKDVGELTLAEDAFLAALPRGPEIYGRAKNADKAIERRNWVLDQMVRNGKATVAEAEAAKAQPLGIIPRRGDNWDPANGYFVEEVRRLLIGKYGENAENGPNSVYAGGLWVRTSLDPELQKAAQDALRAGLMRYGGGRAFVKPIDHIDVEDDGWQGQLASLNRSVSYLDWRIALVIARDGPSAALGFADGTKGLLGTPPAPLRKGDVIAVAPAGTDIWALRVVPEISGGMLLENPHSGRVLAMQGGFDAGLGSFNRATQAERQPGSTIKPFVYGTGLDFGMSPSSEVVDGKFCVYQGASLGQKCFQNFGGQGGANATHTMRWGLEQSRNLMTVRIASDTGMDHVVNTFERVGIGKYPPYLSFALGAGETTVQQMVNAYAALGNNGLQFAPSVIDYVQDRNGKVIWRADNRRCTGCEMPEWDGKPMPRFDSRLGSFNRATQAERQPGSTIKPFVYGTGLDFGMSPSSEVVDGQFCVYQGASLGKKCFQNFGGQGGGNATHTMRWGLEQSRNLMTVRIANDTGMDHVVNTFERVGIGKYPPYLSFALGAGETTVQQLVNAYAALANNGIQFAPSVIDYVQDRSGKVIWRADNRRCTSCEMPEWDGKSMPRFDSRGKQVLDARTAFQVVHMLEGVVTRGTAITLADLNLPLFGKTGTTSGPTNVWFCGGNQDIVGGVYLGYDAPRSLGGYAQGGTIAAPIFKQLILATKPRWSAKPFVAPRDIHWVKVDRVSGKRVFGGAPESDAKASVIWEAFKAESEARPGMATEEIEAQRNALINAIKRGASRGGRAPSAETSAGDANEPSATPTIPADGGVAVQ